MKSNTIFWDEVKPEMRLEAKEGSWFADGKLVYWTGETAAEARATLGSLYQRQRARDNLFSNKPRLFINATEILRVYETFNGDLYFISEESDEEIFCYARLYSMPEFAEWGWNSLDNLREQYGKLHIWEVKREAWPNLKTYSVDGLRIVEGS